MVPASARMTCGSNSYVTQVRFVILAAHRPQITMILNSKRDGGILVLIGRIERDVTAVYPMVGIAIIQTVHVDDIESPVNVIALHSVGQALDAKHQLIELDPVRADGIARRRERQVGGREVD